MKGFACEGGVDEKVVFSREYCNLLLVGLCCLGFGVSSNTVVSSMPFMLEVGGGKMKALAEVEGFWKSGPGVVESLSTLAGDCSANTDETLFWPRLGFILTGIGIPSVPGGGGGGESTDLVTVLVPKELSSTVIVICSLARTGQGCS